MKLISCWWIAVLLLAVTACQTDEMQVNQDDNPNSPMNAYMELKSAGAVEITPDLLGEINENLEASGAAYRVLKAETLSALGSNEMGVVVLAKNVGNKQLGADFVPNDDRRPWSGANPEEITYAIDQTGDAVPPGGGLSAAETDAAIERGFMTWQEATCADLVLARNGDFGIDIGVIAFLNGFGGSSFIFADIQNAGWRDIDFAGGVLGATFTFIFVEGGEPTDIDNNGKADVAFREIYYDPSWIWADDGVNNVDVESVAVHEIGHGLSQAHFGNIFVTKDGYLKAAPRAVMNALYAEPFRVLQGTDIAGHCSIWSSWPNN